METKEPPKSRLFRFLRDPRHGFAWRAAQASANSKVFTKHETRDTKHGFFQTRITRHGFYRRLCARGGAARNLRPVHCARRQVTVFQFTIVHYCSLLFAIVRKNIVWSQCPLSVHTDNAACKVFTNHETRVTKHGFYGRPVAAFLRVVAQRLRRYGAAVAVERHGRHIAPAPASLPRQRFSVGLTTSPVR